MIGKLRAYRKWKRAERFYRNLIPADTLCFDVGANVGDKAVVLARLGHPVVAFEPQQQCLGQLKQRLSPYPKAVVSEVGLSDQKGEAMLQLCSMNEVSSLSQTFIDHYKRYDYLTWEKEERIQVDTLDHMIERHGMPGFCKVDVEGHELKVLQGLSTAIPLIEFEFNAPFKEEALRCVERLMELGDYRFNYSTYEHFRMELNDFVSPEQFTVIFQALPESVLTGDIYARV